MGLHGIEEGATRPTRAVLAHFAKKIPLFSVLRLDMGRKPVYLIRHARNRAALLGNGTVQFDVRGGGQRPPPAKRIGEPNR